MSKDIHTRMDIGGLKPLSNVTAHVTEQNRKIKMAAPKRRYETIFCYWPGGNSHWPLRDHIETKKMKPNRSICNVRNKFLCACRAPFNCINFWEQKKYISKPKKVARAPAIKLTSLTLSSDLLLF